MIGQLLWNSVVAIIYGSSTHCIFLDLARAFDSVSHPRLLLKLESLGITGDILIWLKAFLTSRR